jgi:hypothetical protein
METQAGSRAKSLATVQWRRTAARAEAPLHFMIRYFARCAVQTRLASKVEGATKLTPGGNVDSAKTVMDEVADRQPLVLFSAREACLPAIDATASGRDSSKTMP